MVVKECQVQRATGIKKACSRTWEMKHILTSRKLATPSDPLVSVPSFWQQPVVEYARVGHK